MGERLISDGDRPGAWTGDDVSDTLADWSEDDAGQLVRRLDLSAGRWRYWARWTPAEAHEAATDWAPLQ